MSNFKPGLVDVDIDKDLFVNCPKQPSFGYVSALKICAKCEFHHGVIQMQEKDNSVPWEIAYRIGCVYLTTRTATRIDIGEGS